MNAVKLCGQSARLISVIHKVKNDDYMDSNRLLLISKNAALITLVYGTL